MLQGTTVTPAHRPLRPREPGADFERRHDALSHPYTFAPNPLLERQAARESNARSYPRRIPLALRRAEGIYVEDIHGRVFIDCLAGAGTLALGHNHPVVIEAIEEVLKDGLPLHTLDLTTPVKDRFVQELFDSCPQILRVVRASSSAGRPVRTQSRLRSNWSARRQIVAPCSHSTALITA